jgi:hypothetical protein
MASWAEVYFGARFKKVADGWIFMGPSKRLSEKRDHYLVNDEQKATILAAAPSPGLILTFLGLMAVLGPALVVMFLAIFKSVFGHLPQGILQQSPATIGLVTLVIIVSIAFFRNLDRRLLPLVADFPLSTEPMTRRDVDAALAKVVGPSTGRLIAIGLAVISGISALDVINTMAENHFILTSSAASGMITSITSAAAALAIYSLIDREFK